MSFAQPKGCSKSGMGCPLPVLSLAASPELFSGVSSWPMSLSSLRYPSKSSSLISSSSGMGTSSIESAVVRENRAIASYNFGGWAEVSSFNMIALSMAS